MTIRKRLSAMICLLFILQIALPAQSKAAVSLSVNEVFNKNVAKELNAYIKKAGGDVTLHYRDLNTGDEYSLNSGSARKAASTIKLPLALYVMELASQKKLNLNEKLTYQVRHHYGGSGVIQNQKVGTGYTIRDLVKKAMVHSDNIAFIMLRERVGKSNFIAYMKRVGGKYAYPNGQNLTSSRDLVIYATRLHDFSQKHELGKELVNYLEHTDYNTTIPKGIKGAKTAHKVGMIPMSLVYNDIGIVYEGNPFVLAVMTNKISYVKSQQVIADIAAIFQKHHKVKSKVAFIKVKSNAPFYDDMNGNTSAGNLSKGESFEIVSTRGVYYGIRFGKRIVYVEKKWVVAYPGSSSGFSNAALKYSGTANAANQAKVLSKASASGKTMATLQQGAIIDFEKMVGDYYQTLIGDRYGYVHKNQAQLQYSASIRMIQIAVEEAPMYGLENGKFVMIGNIAKGGVYPRIREQDGYNVVQLGTTYAYIAKKDAIPVYAGKITDQGGAEAAGFLILEQDELIYSNKGETTTQPIIGKLKKGQKITYVQKHNQYYEINYLGRKAYIE